ncbi:MAG: hypothetical protein AAF495_24150 [Pseudomonadota bacterium]
MRFPLLNAAALALALGLTATPAAAQSEAHAHIGHVITAWGDTPEGAGLLPTAQSEANVAAQHAGYAASDPANLDSMKAHTGHVMHAIDPRVEPQGPGAGYGVKAAAQGVADHIGFAAASADASDNVKTHAQHVSTSAGNVVGWSEEIIVLGKQVKAANDAAEAAPLVLKIRVLSEQIANGTDSDGDGGVSWKKGEGGLAQAEAHMGFMMKGEGL